MKVRIIIFGLFLLFLLFIPFSSTQAAMFISPEELKDTMNNHDRVIIDTRSTFAFFKGHIKGAIHLDSGCGGGLCHRQKELPCVLKNDAEIIALLREKGICPQKRIILYGDRDNWGAEGRLYWILEKIGFQKLAVLDGGFGEWRKLKLPTALLPSGNLPACEGPFPAEGRIPRLSASELFSRIKKGQALVIDTRTMEEFQGAVLYGEKHGGHLPGSYHLHWLSLLTDDYRLKEKSQLFQLLTSHGIPLPEEMGDRTIVTLCTGGVRSGFFYLVLKYLGYPRVENYDNGFWEWALEDLPVEK